ncbi:conserved hypothetical protein [Ricinus communis]|uniref:Uncharacterized protein n=1 Tax=Ricinus communis TaxID=3988 RepID=B9SMV5_RICCO|nr:conserved hypothetical protein [Ricinus communis]
MAMGHKELHDRPVVASEIIRRNPKCVVAYPNVFQQPWAIVAPDTILMLGQKFYVLPISTIRKLQRHSLKHSSSHNNPISETKSESPQEDNNEPKDSGRKEGCFVKINASWASLAIILPGANSRRKHLMRYWASQEEGPRGPYYATDDSVSLPFYEVK